MEGPKKKKRKGQCYYLFFHTCASKQHLVLHVVSLIYCASKQHLVPHVVSLISCLFILVGIFHYRTLLVYSNDGFPQIALGLREQASWMHTHLVSFVEISYIYSSSASVACQSLLLMLTSIDGHLHSPLISLVNVILSPFLSSPHNLHHHILFHPQCYIHGLCSCIA